MDRLFRVPSTFLKKIQEKGRGKKNSKSLTFIFILFILSLALAACGDDPSLNQDKNSDIEVGVADVEDTSSEEGNDENEANKTNGDTNRPPAAKIKEMHSCDQVGAAISDLIADLKVDSSHFDDEGYSCYWAPKEENLADAHEEDYTKRQGRIDIIATFYNDNFSTGEELEEIGFKEVF